jgi:hypothetical protein
MPGYLIQRGSSHVPASYVGEDLRIHWELQFSLFLSLYWCMMMAFGKLLTYSYFKRRMVLKYSSREYQMS